MRLERVMEKGIQFLLVFLLGLNLVLCCFAEFVEERSAAGTGRHNLICLTIGFVLIVLLAFFYISEHLRKTRKNRFHEIFAGLLNKHDRIFLLVTSILFLGCLIFATHFYYFETGWDAGTVIWNAELLADGKTSTLDNAYFSICSNNVLLPVFFSYIIRTGRLLPIGTDYYVLIAFQCVCVVICSNIIYKTGLAWSLSRPAAHLVRCVFVLVAVISPWMVLPYSDTIALFVMVVVLYVYALNKHNMLLGFLVIFGAMIKPTVLIFAIALFIVKTPIIFKNLKDKKTFRNIVLFALGALIAFVLSKAMISSAGFKLDSEKSLGPAHYFMMGLNEEERGVVNVEDQFYSIGIESSSERNEANVRVAKERLAELWPGRLAHHLLRKELYSCGDGTFAWGVEGQFFQTTIWTGHERLEDIFRNIYYPGRKNYGLFSGFMQSMWLGMLLLSIISVFTKSRKKYAVLYLTIIGMILFELLFEPRARHLLPAIPIICILASDAASIIASKIRSFFA